VGTENLFRKRKARQAKDLRRQRESREAYDKVLIVCEGEKTEPYYFQGLRAYYKLNTANVEVTGKCESSPKNVLDYALERYKKEDKLGDAYDQVYCVFDKDIHSTYQLTLDRIASLKYNKKKKTVIAITSVPCFEYWLLLHYEYTTKPFRASGSESAADNIIAELRKYRTDYKKAEVGLFSKLFDKLELAKSNAERATIEAKNQNTDNPSTRVHELVGYLQNIKG